METRVDKVRKAKTKVKADSAVAAKAAASQLNLLPVAGRRNVVDAPQVYDHSKISPEEVNRSEKKRSGNGVIYVPVIGSTGIPLMPCHPARARELVRKGRAKRRFLKGFFYIQLTDRENGDKQSIWSGIDPGSKKEGFTVKSEKTTFLNIQADAVTHVKDAVEVRRNMRRTRRNRKTPCRQPRFNRERRSIDWIPPSTKARWDWKLRIARILSQLYPISGFVVEDVAAKTKPGQKKWNKSFSPLEVGKKNFYVELAKIARVEIKQGFETVRMREVFGLKKTKSKMAEVFEAHCVDSWVLAASMVGGKAPDNTRIVCISPLRFHRRQLHVLQPAKGGERKPYGGTRSLGFKRGSLVKHVKFGVVYIGGTSKNRISLHSIGDGKRLTQNAKPADCKFMAYTLAFTMKGRGIRKCAA